MKKLVFALALAVSLVLPLGIVTAFAGVSIVYENPGTAFYGGSVKDVEFDYTGETYDDTAARSIVGYLNDTKTGEAEAAVYDRDADQITWLGQAEIGAALPETFPIGVIPGTAVNNDVVSVWVNDELVGDAKVVLLNKPTMTRAEVTAVALDSITIDTDAHGGNAGEIYRIMDKAGKVIYNYVCYVDSAWYTTFAVDLKTADAREIYVDMFDLDEVAAIGADQIALGVGESDLRIQLDVEVPFDITWNVDGEVAAEEEGYPEVYNYDETNAFVLPEMNIRRGYTSNGWFADAEYTEAVTEIPAATEEAKSFYGYYTVDEYTVEMDGKGGSYSGFVFPTTYTIEDTIALPDGTKSNMFFGGWMIVDVQNEDVRVGTNDYVVGDIITEITNFTGDLKLEAVYTAVEQPVDDMEIEYVMIAESSKVLVKAENGVFVLNNVTFDADWNMIEEAIVGDYGITVEVSNNHVLDIYYDDVNHVFIYRAYNKGNAIVTVYYNGELHDVATIVVV